MIFWTGQERRGQNHMNSAARGRKQPQLSLPRAGALPLCLPDLPARRARLVVGPRRAARSAAMRRGMATQALTWLHGHYTAARVADTRRCRPVPAPPALPRRPARPR